MSCGAKAGGIENAGIYGVDRTYCGLYVDQNWINQELRIGAKEHNVSVAQALSLSADKMLELQDYLNKLPLERVVSYCASRTNRQTSSEAGKNF